MPIAEIYDMVPYAILGLEGDYRFDRLREEVLDLSCNLIEFAQDVYAFWNLREGFYGLGASLPTIMERDFKRNLNLDNVGTYARESGLRVVQVLPGGFSGSLGEVRFGGRLFNPHLAMVVKSKDKFPVPSGRDLWNFIEASRRVAGRLY